MLKSDFLKSLLPLIADELDKKTFEPQKIFEKLIEETSLSDAQAKIVTEKVVRFFISNMKDFKIITPSLIREIINVILLKENGFNKNLKIKDF